MSAPRAPVITVGRTLGSRVGLTTTGGRESYAISRRSASENVTNAPIVRLLQSDSICQDCSECSVVKPSTYLRTTSRAATASAESVWPGVGAGLGVTGAGVNDGVVLTAGASPTRMTFSTV